MKKKLGVFLILGALCASLLAGCSFGGQPTADTPSDLPSSSNAASAVESETSSSQEEVSSTPESQPEETKPTIGWETAYQNTNGQSSAMLVKITGDSNPAINAINGEIDEIRRDYEEDLQELDNYSWVEYTAAPSGGERFVNIVVHNITYPTYAYQGEIKTFIYDIENERQISEDEVLRQLNLSEDALQQMFAGYYNNLHGNNQYRTIDDFEVEGAILSEDGSATLFLQVETEDGPSMPMEYITGSSNELYVYNSASDAFSVFNFSNF